ncbi:MAG TPA: hypothetical protein VM432_05750 [Bdellovibrionales bacterium]|nr:hypothetical protein [Bdellovibrionales bacterium]
MLRVLMVSILMMMSASPAIAAPTSMSTFKGKVAISDIAQIMANRYDQPVIIERAQIRSRANPKRIQKFVFSAVIGGKAGRHDARCAFVRTAKADGIACRSKTAKFDPIRINWKRDTLR